MFGTERSVRPPTRVLLVDDAEDYLALLKYQLERFSEAVNVVAVNNPVHALTLATEKKFDIVLSDLTMPQMDGLTLARLIQESGAETPIILLSGREMALDNTADVSAVVLKTVSLQSVASQLLFLITLICSMIEEPTFFIR